MQIVPGLYELIVSQLLAQHIQQLDNGLEAEFAALDEGEAHNTLAQYLQYAVSDTLGSIKGPSRLQKQVQICNRVVRVLHEAAPSLELSSATVVEDARQLLSVFGRHTATRPMRPDTPLAISSLLTGTRLDPSLLSQLKKEILAADRIDILCSFIKWSGTRVLESELREFVQKPNAQLRVITTSYMGATDIKAVDFLQSLPNTALKVSYDTHRTRLHAKSYLFHRNTGFGAAYVGSSNLSHAAMTEGLEWNIKVSQYESPHLWLKLNATFETYWNDPDFEIYSEQEHERLRRALQGERATPPMNRPSFLTCVHIRFNKRFSNV